ncbi:MAG: hypothetical protein AAF250_13465 [Pseudomonadota bacterium]
MSIPLAMPSRRLSTGLGAIAALALTACDEPTVNAEPHSGNFAQPAPNAERPQLGLMTSLPLYWPTGMDFGDIAQGNGETPWQRDLMEQQFRLTPLDTLTPIPALSSDEPDTDPLAGLSHLAVIQPRGLSAADNVALDQWVRDGGRLLLVLDPMLTSEYDMPLGDPRRPVGSALIPPVVKRWGLEVSFDEDQPLERQVPLGADVLNVSLAGDIQAAEGSTPDCEIVAEAVVARCSVEQGSVTLLADADVFEHEYETEAEAAETLFPLARFMRFAFP